MAVPARSDGSGVRASEGDAADAATEPSSAKRKSRVPKEDKKEPASGDWREGVKMKKC